ncbi:MAG: hypothetical protein CBC55_04955 [Gammaproteobacteria bacterium TMED95]|nr:MAG: hypothetical protein CBC55_04955 [Gammaproteobacteria bacterium TMED95]|tara:strand:+ start:4638 stop:4901 length:264 start_codon:yes stop_codon:yes gene_type:complete
MEIVSEYLALVLSLLALLFALHGNSFTEKAHQPEGTEDKANLKKDFDEAILRDDKPAAMKAYRHLKGCGLKEAKAHVESVLSNQPNN